MSTIHMVARSFSNELDSIQQYRSLLEALETSARDPSARGQPGSSIGTAWSKFPQRKIYAYAAIIISAYGALELFIEQLVEALVRGLASASTTAGDLPSKIRRKHLEKSLDLLALMNSPNYKGTGTVKQTIGKLHSALVLQDPKSLNTEAFALHRANVRCSVVDAIFRDAGVESISSRAMELAKRYEREDHKVGRLSRSWWRIDDLAERRNEVGHGVPSEVLSLEILNDYIEECRTFSRFVSEICLSEVARQVAQHRAHRFSKVLNVFNSRVVCVESDGLAIKEGDGLLAETGDPTLPFRTGSIRTIEVNNESVGRIEAGESVMVGLETDSKIKSNYIFYLLPSSASRHRILFE